MILHRLRDWLRPERCVFTFSPLKVPGPTSGVRFAFNEQDELVYAYARRWRWSR